MASPPQGIPVDDTPHPCAYLPDRTAVLPLRWYRSDLDGQDFDALLASSDRRVGRTLYRPECPACDECKGIRVPIDSFAMSKSQRRVWRRNQDLKVFAGPALANSERLDLFNKHKLQRNLSEQPTTLSHYKQWLVLTNTHTIETRYVLDGKLVGVGVLDLGKRDASSVYFYFDPDHSDRSMGTFSVLAEIAWLRAQGYRYYYLGLYVRDCAQLNYKARFKPHERLVQGRWQSFG
jgi:arginine-tRNA-protein transferase